MQMMLSGMNAARLNFSHGTHEDKKKIIGNITKINKDQPYNIAILADLQGPKLRVGDIEGGFLDIQEGDVLTFTNEKVIGNKHKIYISYPDLHKDVQVGEKILIDDGRLEVVVKEICKNNDVKVSVVLGGKLLPKKGVNLPDTNISLPSLTEKDLADLAFILNERVDWVALSFVRRTEDIT